MDKEKYEHRWAEAMEFLMRDPIAFYERALTRRKHQVKWLENKIKELKEERGHGDA